MAPCTVLYIDDEPDLLLLGKEFLESIGEFTIDTRQSAEEGLSELRAHPYDAVISDYQMPEMDGLAFLKAVRQEFGSLPFLLFTGRGREDVVIEAINLGADFYVQKGGAAAAQFAELAHKITMAVDRKRAIQALAASEQQLSALFHASPIHQVITEYTSDRIIDINDLFLKNLRLSREQVIGRTLWDVGLMPDPEQMASMKNELAKTNVVRNVPVTIRGRSGMVYTSLTSMTRVQVHGKDLVYTQSVDITSQRKAQQTIDALINAPLDVLLLLDPTGRILAVNEAAAGRYKIPVASLIGMDVTTLQSDEYRARRKEALDTVVAGKTPFTYTDDRVEKVYENHLYPVLDTDGNVTAVAVYSHDATEEISAQRALNESEEKYRLVVEHSHDSIYIHRDNKFVFINRQAEDLSGYTHEELMQRDWSDFIHPEDREQLKQQAARRFAGGEVSSSFQARILRKDGEVREGEFFVDLVEFQGGPAILGIARDITEKMQNEAELRTAYQRVRESEEKYRILVEHTGEGVFIVQDGNFVFVNDKLAAMIGYCQEDLAGMPFVRHVAPEDREMIVENYHRCISGQEFPDNYEISILFREGPRRIRGRIGVGLARYQGRPAIIGTFRDVTEEREREAALAASEARYRGLTEYSGDVIMLFDRQLRHTYVNPMAEKFSGLKPEQFIGKTHAELGFPADLVKIWEEALTRAFTKGLQVQVEFQLPASGAWMDWLVIPIHGPDGTVQEVMTSSREITDRRNAEEAVRQSEELYRTLINASPDGICRVDPEGVLTYASPRALEMFGLSDPGDVIGTNVLHWIIEEDRPVAISRFTEIRQKGVLSNNTYRMIRKDGSVIDIDMHSAALHDHGGAVTGIISVLRDITERRRAEAALRESEENYRRLITSTFDAVVIYQDDRIIVANDASARIVGCYRGEDLVGKSILSFIHPDSRPVVIGRQQQMLETPGGVAPLIPEKFLRADGTPVDVEVMASRIQHDGRTAIQVIFRDITARKQAEEALRQSEEKYRRIIENMQDVFYRTDPEGTLTMVSSYGAHLMGFASADELIGKYKVTDFFADPKESSNFMKQLMEQKEVSGYRVTLADRSGKTHQALANSHILTDDDGNISGVEGILHDVTNIIEVKNALRQANRQIKLMTSITRHDIRNQLFALNGWLEMSRRAINEPERQLELITKEQHIADTIRQQIDFTTFFDTIGVNPPLWQNISDLVVRARSALAFGTVELETAPLQLEVFADLLLEKVFFNIFDNAIRHAGPAMNRIMVTWHLEDTNLVIVISDNGIGIEEKNKKKIFSRGFGKNTGLGLFLASEVLAITGFSIRETGMPGKGARFEILFPEGKYRMK